MAFNLRASRKITSSKRIKDRGIVWQEKYTKKTMAFKKKFNKHIGPGSYYRFEGHDNTTGNDYYIIVGPGFAKTKGKLFFAGIRKLPGEFSANGEYFKTLRKAMLYAKDMWGPRFPKDFHDYTTEDLLNVRV